MCCPAYSQNEVLVKTLVNWKELNQKQTAYELTERERAGVVLVGWLVR
jgi:hypothetical protein